MSDYKVTQVEIDYIKATKKEKVWEPFPGVTVVAWQLPTGFTITASSGCIDPANYDLDLGISICRKHLEDKLWELEGYAKKKTLVEQGVL